jgi:hypothetical protein
LRPRNFFPAAKGEQRDRKFLEGRGSNLSMKSREGEMSGSPLRVNAWLRQLWGRPRSVADFLHASRTATAVWEAVAIALAEGFDDESKTWPPADVVNRITE